MSSAVRKYTLVVGRCFFLFFFPAIKISFWNETAQFHWVSVQENKRTLFWFNLFGTTLQAYYPFTAQDEQCQITQIYSAAPHSVWFPHPIQEKKNVFLPSTFYNKNNNAVPLVFGRLKEGHKLMETPPHNAVVYFHLR